MFISDYFMTKIKCPKYRINKFTPLKKLYKNATFTILGLGNIFMGSFLCMTMTFIYIYIYFAYHSSNLYLHIRY